MSDSSLQRIYAAFDPAPLTTEQTNLYVPLDDLRGEADIVRRLAGKIQLANGKPTCQVLAGHRGSGKSTEFFRLKHELESDKHKMFVVFCKADEDTDRNDVDFPDLLIAIVRQAERQLRENVAIKLKPGYFKDRLQRLKNLFTREVDIDKLDLKTALGDLSVTIKGSPDARSQIRNLMDPDTGNLLNAANDVFSDAVQQLVKRQYQGLVILVDDLDKMVVRHHDSGCSTAEYLFVNRAAQLTAFNCHVVYSMPISLAYSHQENAIKTSFGGHVPVVPMTKIRTRPPNSKPHKPGVERFRQIINARLQVCGVKEDNVFADRKVCEYLIRLSAGQPSELMTLVREAIITHGLPIDDKSLERAQREGQREYARQLRAEHWPIIEAVRKTGRFDRSAETEALFRELLESRTILQYVNDEEWYGLNPMVEALKRPTKPTRSTDAAR